MSPAVSINLCCYNGEKYLEEALQSIFSQTFSDWELVIINDGSTDSSEAIIKGHISEGWPLVYHYQENAGLAAARNKALEMSSGSIIAFIDQDDIWMPKKLEKQMQLFDDPEVGLVFCDVVFFNNKGQTKQLYKNKPYWTGRCFSYLLSRYFLSLPTVAIRHSTLDILEEWFDPRFKMIEEADLFTRIGYFWKLAMVNEPLAKWRVHASSFTYSKNNPFAEEIALMIAKYGKIFPDFDKTYLKEIQMLLKQAAIDKALHNLRTGNRSAARSCLSQYKSSSLKASILFLLTLLPTKLISFLYRLKSKFVLSSPIGHDI